MRPLFVILSILAIGLFAVAWGPNIASVQADQKEEKKEAAAAAAVESAKVSSEAVAAPEGKTFTRMQVLVGSLTVFTLAVLVGFEIISKVPPTLHTPLMSGSNAISGITVVGALLAAGNQLSGFASFLGLLAVILANINVVGGFLVTHRMLLMFKKK